MNFFGPELWFDRNLSPLGWFSAELVSSGEPAPFGGLLAEYDVWEMQLNVDPTSSSVWTFGGFTSTAAASGQIQSMFTPDYLLTANGIRLHGYGAMGGLVEATATIEAPILGAVQTRTYPGISVVSQVVKLIDLKLWMNASGTLRITATNVQWWVNGVLEWQRGVPLDVSGTMTGVPASIPAIGIPPYLTGGAAADPLIVVNGCFEPGPGGSETHAISNVSGGWRFTPKGGSPTALPIEIAPASPYASGSNTWSVTVTSEYKETNTGSLLQQEFSTSPVWILPNLPASVEAMNPDYEGLISRWGAHGYGFERQDYIEEDLCAGGGTNTTETATTTVYPTKSELLARTGGAGLNDLLDRTVYAQASPSYNRLYGTPSVFGQRGWGVVWSLQAPGSPSPALDHAEYPAPFVNTWVNPHWSYGLWFPPDSAASSSRWKLMGGDSPIAYWYAARQQHVTHPALPSGQDTKHRINVVAEPIDQNGVTGLATYILGLPCWWGINRFGILDRADHPDSFETTEDSTPRFTFGSGTGLVGATNIFVDADEMEFEMASFTAFPYMTPTLADRIEIGWDGTNISACSVFAVGADGTKVLIASTAGTHRIPAGLASEWATDALADFGQGELVDTYVSIEPDDESFAASLDERRISSFGLMPSRTPTKIRWEFTRIDTGLPAIIHHPVFHMAPWNTAKVYHETGGLAAILFDDGPGVRYGCLSFYDYLLDIPLTVPQTRGPSQATTIGDLWAWENVFLRGRSALTDLTTRAGDEFVPGEEWTIIDHLWRDPDKQLTTISGFAPSSVGPIGIYSNTFRSAVPPIACFPEGRRLSVASWLPIGALEQRSYSHLGNQMPIIAPKSLELRDVAGGGVNSLTPVTAPAGWHVGAHTIATTGSEGYLWAAHWGGKEWFRMRPWRGAFWVGAVAEAGGWIWNFINRLGHFYRAWSVETGVRITRSRDHLSRLPWAEDVVIGLPDDRRPTLHGLGSTSPVWALWERAGSVMQAKSLDDGRSWSEPVTIMAGAFPTGNQSGSGWRVLACLVYDSGTSGPGKIRIRRQGPGQASPGAAFFAKDQTTADIKVEDGTFHVFPANDSTDTWILSAIPEGETDPAEWRSLDDGLTWKRV